ncbi:alpha/beta-hydrolase [Corynespora cassiicola Philippines]|uniref:Alpha/beta-hydrolase n=1 Tax=Corynespora cassiicola Philippines TaxID=1448308 RepID=A0A2T2NWY0_CORCC|nr:alpha/beta-hydrolase [Corynespora cassiicola Philippines]
MHILYGLLLFTLLGETHALKPAQTDPVVEIRNGPLQGIRSSTYDQDFFLGIPYAQPPLGNLRFRPPQPLNTTWQEPRSVEEYSPVCYQEGGGQLVGSDDCLSINVVRPAGIDASAKLPVLVFIHGGGFFNGSNSAPAQNLSFIVQESVRMGSPIIAVNLNYRLHIFGFLWGPVVEAAGLGNLGLRDQRLALEWIHENIESFGADPTKVTIWGSSAGALSVGSHLTLNGGRDDGLFRGAIFSSGSGLVSEFGEVPRSPTWEGAYQQLQEATGCTSVNDSLQCLRELPAHELGQIALNISFPSFLHIIDGVFIQQPRHESLRQGKFIHVPIIHGITSDDGDATAIGSSINTTQQWESWIRASTGANNESIQAISALYPDIPRLGLPETLSGRPTGELAHYGAQWKRALAFAGDRDFHAPKRAVVRHWASLNLTAYSYHFNVYTKDLDIARGVGHFAELPFIFMNTEGAGYQNRIDPFAGTPDSYKEVARIMGRMWISFANHLNPNQNGVVDGQWPRYDLRSPQNIVFDANVTSLVFTEPDTYRSEQIEYLNSKMFNLSLESGV